MSVSSDFRWLGYRGPAVMAPPQRVEAKFFRREDRVFVDLNQPLRLLDMDYETCFAWARALIKLGEEAQRVAEGHARMSRREVDHFEESICGTPKLIGS